MRSTSLFFALITACIGLFTQANSAVASDISQKASADAAIDLTVNYVEREFESSTVDYLINVVNHGPDVVPASDLFVRLIETGLVGTDGDDCQVFYDRGYDAFVCRFDDLQVGEQRQLNIQARVTAHSSPPGAARPQIEAELRTRRADELDLSNNELEHMMQIASGNNPVFAVETDRDFVSESYGQASVNVVRQTTAKSSSGVSIDILHDSSEWEDISVRTGWGLDWGWANSGSSLASIFLTTGDADEGPESMTIEYSDRVLASALRGVYPTSLTIIDDRTDLTSAGTFPMEERPTFVESAQELDASLEPAGIAFGDIDGDSIPDIVSANWDITNGVGRFRLTMFFGDDQGRMDENRKIINLSEKPNDVAVGDLNGDGRNDVVVALQTGLQVYEQNSLGNLQLGQFIPTVANLIVKAADIDANGTMDLVSLAEQRLIENNGDNFDIYRQALNGTISLAHRTHLRYGGDPEIAIADIDSNGFTDIVVASDTGTGDEYSDLLVIWQAGDGSFSLPVERDLGGPIWSGNSTEDVDIADLDNDGVPEIIIEDIAYEYADSRISRSLKNLRMDLGMDSHFVDVNRDGRLDIFSRFYEGGPANLFMQKQDGSFDVMTTGEPFRNSASGTRALVADVGLDGNYEFIAADYDGLIGVLYLIPQDADVSVTTLIPPSDIEVGDETEFTFKIANNLDTVSQQSRVQISSGPETKLSQVLGAAGTCGLVVGSDTEAICDIPRLSGGGHIDFSATLQGDSAGTANISIAFLSPQNDVDPTDNTLSLNFSVASAPTPPPPPPPATPPNPTNSGGGGGGGSSDLVSLLALLFCGVVCGLPLRALPHRDELFRTRRMNRHGVIEV